LLAQALQHQQSGQLEAARSLFETALQREPGNVGALYSLAAIESDLGNHEAALVRINQAIAGRADFAQSYLSRSIILSRLGRLKEALTDVDRSLRLDPQLTGAVQHRERLMAAIAAAPPQTSAIRSPGAAAAGAAAASAAASDASPLDGAAPSARTLGAQTPAVAAPGRAANGRANSGHRPSSAANGARAQAAALVAKAMQMQEGGQLADATESFEHALQLDPDNFAALYSLGFLAHQRGDIEKTLELFERAVKAHPREARGWFALGTVLMGRGLHESALNAFDRAIEADPRYIDAYNNKAVLLTDLRRTKDALDAAEAGLAIDPLNPQLLEKKGDFLSKASYQAAAAVFDVLRRVKPDFEYAEGRHAFARMHCCDWTGYDDNRARIIEGVRQGKRVCMPLAFMALSDDANDARRCAEIFAAHRFPPSPQPLWRGERYRHRKTRVAFVSADFRMHPVGYLLIGMIEALDRQQFESIGVSLGVRDGSDLYGRFRNAFDHYLDCFGKHSLEIATLMRAMEVDIVIDLSGYTAGSRLDILSHRPAPVQIGYLGFPGTLALPFVDYILADRYTIPESLQSAYAERVLYLPHCYLPRDTSVIPARDLPPRAHWGLPDEGVVFCSFNHDYKITPSLFDVWADLLRSTPGSVLWLMKLNEDAERNLLASAAARDIDPKRLIFATRVPRIEDHLARLRHADVYLDTYPYNGHTTTSDVILAGVDVVTMSGTSFASRVSGSLLKDHSLGGSVAENLEHYRTRGLALAASADDRREARVAMTSSRPWPIDSAMQGRALGRSLERLSEHTHHTIPHSNS
jgi:predicted O-linked N-acetylglucosamine transferase (SPINDLY family)